MRARTFSMVAMFSLTAAIAYAGQRGNLPWFPSLMAFEHYDSGRTHLFEKARFGGSYDGSNQVAIQTAPVTYPTGYNMAYLSSDDIFLYGGGYGNIANATGAFVAKLDPDTLKPIWSNQLINTAESGEWDYPGVMSILNDGFLYVIYGHRLAKLHPQDGIVIDQVDLPTGGAAPGDTSYNGFDALPDGTLIAKTLYREQGCELQGPDAIFKCPDPGNVPPSTMISVDPQTLQVRDQVTLPSTVGGRPTTARFHGHDYVYLATTETAIRYRIDNGQFTLDQAWNPGSIYQTGQKLGSAVVVMNDWIVIQTNGSPATAPLGVVVINQGDATQHFSTEPFATAPVPPGYPTSWAPMSVSVDPYHNLIYTAELLSWHDRRLGVDGQRPEHSMDCKSAHHRVPGADRATQPSRAHRYRNSVRPSSQPEHDGLRCLAGRANRT